MGKNIVIFSDGTGQDGGSEQNTNVYKLFNLILDRSRRQVSFYDRGLGTGWRKATGNIAGRGFSKNVLECYEFIFQNFQDDDKIYLFGFSRGAATVRSLTSFIHLFGILPRSRGRLLKEAWKIYKIKNHEKRTARAAEFVKVNHTMWAHVEFLGVWDTVAALGLPNTKVDKLINLLIPHGFHDFNLSECVKHACHALAIDDRRKQFHPVLFHPDVKKGQTSRQVWFMGMHTNVGGGYRDHELSDIVLEWMVQHAVRHGLHIFKPKKREGPLCTPNPNGFMEDSRGRFWKRVVFKEKQRLWDDNFYGKAVIHESVKLRSAGIDNQENGGYAPWILDHHPEVELWTHLADWRVDPSFGADAQRSLDALEGWCAPKRPAAAAPKEPGPQEVE
jgi:T6SS, Phospholipase effector Tle1-like, catalytic domain